MASVNNICDDIVHSQSDETPQTHLLWSLVICPISLLTSLSVSILCVLISRAGVLIIEKFLFGTFFILVTARHWFSATIQIWQFE